MRLSHRVGVQKQDILEKYEPDIFVRLEIFREFHFILVSSDYEVTWSIK